MARTSHSRVARAATASAVAVGLAIALAACSPGADAPDASLGFHQILTYYSPPLANPDLTAEDRLDALGLEASDTATATMEWFIAGDCATSAPVTELFVGACDPEGTTLYLLAPAALTGQDLASVEPLEEGGLTVEFTADGTERFAQLTARTSAAEPPRNQVAIVLNDQVLSDPAVQEKITTDAAEITSTDTDRDWEALASALRRAAQG